MQAKRIRLIGRLRDEPHEIAKRVFVPGENKERVRVDRYAGERDCLEVVDVAFVDVDAAGGFFNL